jgi:hypothetical protein
MAKRVSLSVNDVPIQLDEFVEGYVYHIVSGIIASLKGTGEIENLELSIDNEEQVTITLNGADVPIKYFPNEIIRSTIFGMVSMLKGVREVDRLQLIVTTE